MEHRRPSANSWPLFVPITFELGVLGAGLSAVVGMMALLNGLPMSYHPLFNVEEFATGESGPILSVHRVSRRQFDRERTRTFFEALHPIAVREVPW